MDGTNNVTREQLEELRDAWMAWVVAGGGIGPAKVAARSRLMQWAKMSGGQPTMGDVEDLATMIDTEYAILARELAEACVDRRFDRTPGADAPTLEEVGCWVPGHLIGPIGEHEMFFARMLLGEALPFWQAKRAGAGSAP